MTREEAIYVLKNTAWLGSEELVGDVSEAIKMAVNALKRSETPNSSDVISRQAAIDAIEHRLAEPAYQHTGEDWYVGMNCAESELYELQSVQPEIVMCKDCKHWINGHLCESLSRFGSFETKEDFYCGYAKRRTDETD